jgi:hypothetical protein
VRAAREAPDAGRELVVGQWGLVPWFAKTPKLPYSTNNARAEELAAKATFKHPWARGQRCIIPAVSFDEPNWESGKNAWWRFRRADGRLWGLAGLWNTWTDKATGEIVESYTMLTLNADDHPLMRRMHKPDLKLGPISRTSGRWCRSSWPTSAPGLRERSMKRRSCFDSHRWRSSRRGRPESGEPGVSIPALWMALFKGGFAGSARCACVTQCLREAPSPWKHLAKLLAGVKPRHQLSVLHQVIARNANDVVNRLASGPIEAVGNALHCHALHQRQASGL